MGAVPYFSTSDRTRRMTRAMTSLDMADDELAEVASQYPLPAGVSPALNDLGEDVRDLLLRAESILTALIDDEESGS